VQLPTPEIYSGIFVKMFLMKMLAVSFLRASAAFGIFLMMVLIN